MLLKYWSIMEGIWWIDLKWNSVCDSKEPVKRQLVPGNALFVLISSFIIFMTLLCLIEAEWKLN